MLSLVLQVVAIMERETTKNGHVNYVFILLSMYALTLQSYVPTGWNRLNFLLDFSVV